MTSRISKVSSINQAQARNIGGTGFQHKKWSKKCNFTVDAQIKSQLRSPSSTRRKKEGTVNQLEFQPSPRVANSSCDSRRRLKYQADCKQYRNYYECEYCPLKSKDRSPLFFQVHRAQSHLQVIHVNLKKQSTSSKQMLVTYKETICWLHMSYLPTWLDVKYCTDISDHRRAVNGEPPND